MTDPATCAHEHTQPVEIRSHQTGGTEVVARICTACLTQLPAAWGCTGCEWIEEPRRLCDPANFARLIPGQPCQEHA